jgi:hypothetical protein
MIDSRSAAEASSPHAAYVAGLDPMERYEVVTEVVRWASAHHPVGLPLFDQAWSLVQAAKPFRRPEDCALVRTVVGQFLCQLLDLQEVANVKEAT